MIRNLGALKDSVSYKLGLPGSVELVKEEHWRPLYYETVKNSFPGNVNLTVRNVR